MKKFILTFVSGLMFMGVYAQNQPEVIFTGTPTGVMGISSNNRYICGTRIYESAYRFDMETRTLITIPAQLYSSEMCAADVMDDGTLIGKNDLNFPAYWKNEDEGWIALTLPQGNWTGGNAFSCTGDGKYIVGHIMGKGTADKPYSVVPCIWYLQPDGSYEYEALPNPSIDFLGGKTQFISPRAISADGNTIVGGMVEERGDFYQPIIYRKGNDGTWTYEMPFVEKSFNMEVYAEWQEKRPKQEEYITAQPGDPDYMTQVKEFQAAIAKWQYGFFTAWKKGPEFTTFPVIMSDNGRFLAPAVQETTYSYTEGETFVDKTSKVYPCYYDLNSKELVTFEDIPDFQPFAISNDGDMLSSDSYNIYLIPHGEKTKIELSEWLKKEYNGFDLNAILPSNTEYKDCQTLANDMSVIFGTYISVTESGELDNKEVFAVKLPKNTSSIMETLNTPQSELITIKNGTLYFSNTASDIRIFNLIGKEVKVISGNMQTADVSSLAHGVYVVKAKINGKDIKAKVYKR